jgi:methionine synthase I (cobalamin-dependent)
VSHGGFLTALAQRPLLLDAAMGTRLAARGLILGRDEPSAWSLTRPETVLAIHRRDIEAGADAILTNTFGANRLWLNRFGLGDQLFAIVREAVLLARQAAGAGRFVIGSLGPAAALQPAAYDEPAALLAGAGVDALLLETFSYEEALGTLAVVSRRTRLPVLVALRDADRLDGAQARRLVDQGAAAVGGNCLPGMGPLLRMARRWRGTLNVPLIAKPSAGLPGEPAEGPEAFARTVPELFDLGVRLFGGCCGTTEDHIAAFRSALDSLWRAPEL